MLSDLMAQLRAPLDRQIQQPIQAQIQMGFGQGHQQIDQGDLPLLPQQLMQTGLQHGRRGLAGLGGQELAQLPQRPYGVLHFATHGLANARQPELSAVVLALVL